MAVTGQDKMATQVAGESTSGGPKRLAVDDDGKIILSNPGESTVPTANSTANAYSRDVIGNKSDAAVTTVGVIASVIAYIKGVLNQLASVKAKTDLIGASVALESGGNVASVKTQTDKIPSVGLFKDIWCADSAVLATLAFSDAAADKDFPNVVVGAAGAVNGIPVGAVIAQVNLILMASTLDSSAAANYINAASKTIRVKVSTGDWGTDDIVAVTLINGDWYTLASGMGSVVFVSATNIASVVTGAGTYNLESNETNRSDAIVALAASLNLKGVRTGFRVYYKLG